MKDFFIDWSRTKAGPYIAGRGGGQLPPLGKLGKLGVKTKRPIRNPVCIREIPGKVCGVCPRRQKILYKENATIVGILR